MRFLFAAVLAACLTALLPGAAPAQKIKLGTLAPQGSPWYNVMRDMGESWKAATGGKVRMRIYPGGIAGDEPDMVRKMKVGQLHAAALSGAGLSRIANEVQALQMPMMFASQEELDYVRERVSPKIEAVLAERGFILLTWGDAGWIYFFTQTPVVHPDDLKPLKLFAWAGETAHIEAWKAAGYKPVPLPATEMHTALQSGLINAFNTTPIAALSFQWFGSAKHMTDLKWAPLVGAVVISSQIWKRISPTHQTQLLELSREAGKNLQTMLPTLSEDAVKVMVSHGLQIHTVPQEVAGVWEQRARAGYPAVVGQIVPAPLVAEVERIRNEYRANQAKR